MPWSVSGKSFLRKTKFQRALAVILVLPPAPELVPLSCPHPNLLPAGEGIGPRPATLIALFPLFSLPPGEKDVQRQVRAKGVRLAEDYS